MRSILFMLVTIFSLLLIFVVHSSANTNGLIGYWNFDTIEGNIVPDLSGNELKGIISDELVPGAEDYPFDETTIVDNGACGNALFFNGQTSKISVDDFPGVNGNMSVELWFKMRNPLRPFLLKVGNLPYAPAALRVTANFSLLAWVTIGDDLVFISGKSEILVNNWYHVALTINSEQIKLYLNGELENIVDVAGNLLLDADLLKLGFNNYPGHDVLDGWLDEVRIYDQALSEEEIHNDMNFCHPEGFDDTLHSLAGVVGGNLQEGIKLELSGNHTETAYTDILGRFSFSDLASGDYSITPHYESCSFTPSSQQVKLEKLNLNQIAFEAAYTANQSLGIKLWESYLGENSYCSGTCALSDDKIFQATFDGNLYCLNKEEGRILWKYTVNSEIPSLIPMNTIVDGNRVYLTGSTLIDPTIKMYGELCSIDIEDGSLIWKKVMGQIEGWPSIYNNNLYVGDCSGKFHCLNKDTGTEVWSYQFGNGDFSNWMQSGQAIYCGKVYFPNSTGTIYCLNAMTGDKLWSSTALGSGFVNLPTLSKGRLYIGGGNDRKLHCVDANTGEEVWSYNAGSPMNGSATVDGDKVYFGRIGHVYCLDAETGKEMWTFKTEGNINNKSMGYNLLAFNPPTIVNGKAHVWAWDNRMYCLNTETGEKIWSFALVEHRMWPAMISEGKIFTGDSKRVYCLNAGSDKAGEWLMFHKNLHRTGCTSVLSGKVMDDNGDPLANVKIEVKGEETSVEASTNNRGYYELADLAEGAYTVEAIKEGYEKTIEQITLHPLAPIDDLDFTLRPSCPVTFVMRGHSQEGNIIILRKFRDEVLSKTPAGQEIIGLYYEWSQVIVKAMEEDEEFREDVKEVIDGFLVLIREGIQ